MRFLHGGPASSNATPLVEPFRLGLAELGYVEGRNVMIEFRWESGGRNRRVQPARGTGSQGGYAHNSGCTRSAANCASRPYWPSIASH
jgi:hypothetical protein